MSNSIQPSQSWKKTTAYFLTGQSISMVGSMIVQYAMMWHITLTLQSGMAMTLFIICGFLPTFLISPIAGIWADRFNRKILIVLADSFIALATLILAILFISGFEQLWLLFVMAAIRAIGTGVHMPAIGAIIPQIVPEDQLMRVNGINGTIQAVLMFIAPVASAALLGVASLSVIFLVDVVTAILGIFTLMRFVHVPAPKGAAKAAEKSFLDDMKLGIAYVKGHSFLKPIMIFFAVFFILFAPVTFLTPIQIARSFGDEVWRLSSIELASSMGMIIGGSLIAIWGGFRNRIATVTTAIVVMSVCLISLGVVSNFFIYLGFMLLSGSVIPFFNTPMNVIFQEKIDPEYMGRVFGILGMITTSMMPMGMIIFGPLADIIEVETVLIMTGVILLFLSVFFFRNKNIYNAGEPVEQAIVEEKVLG